jgi:hypothetical protein
LHGLKSEILPGTALEKASILSIREKLLLTAAHIRQLKTKIKIEFPQNHVLKDDIRKFLHKFQKVKTAA